MTNINIADTDSLGLWAFSLESELEGKSCIFISYSSKDIEAAQAIGKYLNEVVEVAIYLDTKDYLLQTAISEEDDNKIVCSIKKGLKSSTHLLCLISENTDKSWWVPYEFGIADNSNLKVYSLKLKDVSGIPSFIKTHDVLYGREDFIKFASTLSPYGELFYNKNYLKFSAIADNLISYLDE